MHVETPPTLEVLRIHTSYLSALDVWRSPVKLDIFAKFNYQVLNSENIFCFKVQLCRNIYYNLIFNHKIHTTIDMLLLLLLVVQFKKIACKPPKLKNVKTESCQNWKLSKLKVVKIESCQNWKLSKLKITKIIRMLTC